MMDGVDIWGQLAVESSQVYLTDGGVKKSQFADTVDTLTNISCFAKSNLFYLK